VVAISVFPFYGLWLVVVEEKGDDDDDSKERRYSAEDGFGTHGINTRPE
jgi:hypothetical protein